MRSVHRDPAPVTVVVASEGTADRVARSLCRVRGREKGLCLLRVGYLYLLFSYAFVNALFAEIDRAASTNIAREKETDL